MKKVYKYLFLIIKLLKINRILIDNLMIFFIHLFEKKNRNVICNTENVAFIEFLYCFATFFSKEKICELLNLTILYLYIIIK